MTERYAGAARPAPPPAEPLPPLSCDCHLHVFGDPAKFPDRNPNPVHASRAAVVGGCIAHACFGRFRARRARAAANYTTDHSYLLEGAGPRAGRTLSGDRHHGRYG